MKCLVVIVSIVAALTVDGRKPGQEWDNLADSDPQLNDGQHFIADGLEGDFDSSSVNQDQEEEEKEHSENKLHDKGGMCKANLACTIMGGSCIVNASLCSGRLVADGCKGRKCQCCIPEKVNNCVVDNGENSTLWQKVNSAEMAIQAIVNEGNDNVTRDMEMGFQNVTIELESIKDNQHIAMNNLTIANSRLELKLNNMMFHQGCPEGFFTPTGYSTQCFKLLNDSEISWTASRTKCQSLGLVLAKPLDAVSTRRYLMERYGLRDEIWVDAKGTGSTFQWQRDSKYIRTTNPLMYYSSSSYYTTSYCLAMATTEGGWSSYPTKPYIPQSCGIGEFPLCELVMPTGCPDGFFMPTGSKQCFKLFLDAEISWSSAGTKCQSEGLVLAKPHDAISVRSYIMQRYGLNDEIWVGASGTGSTFQWQRDSKYLSTSNPLMYYTSSSYYSTSYCLALATSEGQWNSYPTKPYMPVSCSTSEYPLCELIME